MKYENIAENQFIYATKYGQFVMSTYPINCTYLIFIVYIINNNINLKLYFLLLGTMYIIIVKRFTSIK